MDLFIIIKIVWKNWNLTMTRIVYCTFFLLLWLPVTVQADVVYVNDTLRVGVRSEPNNSIAPIGVVTTGMRLTILERNEGYIKIKTDAGVEGWIKDIYVTDKVPAKIELEQLQEKYRKLSSESGQSGDLIKAAEQTNAALTAEIEQLKTQNQELHTRLMKLQSTATTGGLSLQYLWFLLVLVMFIAGFSLGVLWYRRKAMKRLGGLRF